MDVLQFVAEAPNWLRGVNGELLVHQELTKLPNDFIVFHDFHPLGQDGRPAAWNVDHIVVGPTGVFVLDAKNYSQAVVRSAAHSTWSAKNVRQVKGNASQLQQQLRVWSAGQLDRLFVVPVVVYVQPEAKLETLREGAARTLPLRMLLGEIVRHSEDVIDSDRAKRAARAIFSQLGEQDRIRFQDQLDSFMRAMTAATAVGKESSDSAAEAPVAPGLPTECPRCGGKLVLRTAKKGDRAGRQFLGCENYYRDAHCTYGYNLD